MQLTLYSDFSLRVLFYLCKMPKESATITEIADFYHISRNHLVKVVHQLGQLGFITTTRGKGGGILLARDPKKITVGEVVRKTEPNFTMVECFNKETNQCRITSACRLKSMLNKALEAFFDVLDQYTLAEANTTGLITMIKVSNIKKTKNKMSHAR